MHVLHPHPAHPPRAVTGVVADLSDAPEGWLLSYRVAGGPLAWPAPAAPERTDGLWRTTCFELFAKPVGGVPYREFNFAPSTQWAAYRFDDHRRGMADLAMTVPLIDVGRAGINVMLPLDVLPTGDLAIGLTAVIEEADGTKSYWALAHPAGPPDFHDPACFVLTVPAADAA